MSGPGPNVIGHAGAGLTQRKSGDVVIPHDSRITTTVNNGRAGEFFDDVGDGYGQELNGRLTGIEDRCNERESRSHAAPRASIDGAATSLVSNSVPSGRHRYREAIDIDTNVRQPNPRENGTYAVGHPLEIVRSLDQAND